MRFVLHLLAIGALLSGSGCSLERLLPGGGAAAPPTAAVLNATSIDEAGIDLIRDLFDVGVYGVEALHLTPRTPQAVQVARLIRKISSLLGAADAAQKAGSAASYNEALRNARAALKDFQQAIGMPHDTTSQLLHAPQVRAYAARMTDVRRLAIADRLDPSNRGGEIALR